MAAFWRALTLLSALLASLCPLDAGDACAPTGKVCKVLEKVSPCKIKARKGDVVQVHYTGRLKDQTVFQETLKRGHVRVMTVGKRTPGVVKGLDEGLDGMCLGELRRLVVPPKLGYGDEGIQIGYVGATGTRGNRAHTTQQLQYSVPGGAYLWYEVKLISVNNKFMPRNHPDNRRSAHRFSPAWMWKQTQTQG